MQGEKLTLYFECADFFATRLDNVGGHAALNEIQKASCPRLVAVTGVGVAGCTAEGDVTGFEPRPVPVVFRLSGEFGSGGFRVPPVFFENGRTAELDLAGAWAAIFCVIFLTGVDYLAGVEVDEACFDGGRAIQRWRRRGRRKRARS